MLDLIFAAVVSVVASQAPMPAAPPAPPAAEQAQAAPQTPAAQRAERRRIRACTVVRMHGSRIAHQQCYNPAVLPADDVERRRENAQQWMREAQQASLWR